MGLTLALTGLAVLLSAVGVFFTWNFDYWRKRNFPYYNPFAISSLLRDGWQWAIWEKLGPVYNKYKVPGYAGSFEYRTPVLVVNDPELIKFVLTKEFSSFHDRGQPFDEESDPLSGHLFNQEGEKWKYHRTKLSPTFTSGKLKLMSDLMLDVTRELNGILRESACKRRDVDFKSLLTRFSTDIIGTCAFGVSCNSLKDPDSEFYRMGQEIFQTGTVATIRLFLFLTLSTAFPKLVNLRFFFAKHTTFFLNLMKEMVSFRKAKNIDRNDFVKLIMQMRESEPAGNKTMEFTDNLMAANAFLFFLAGLENISNTIGFCLNELAHNEELQERAATEVSQKVKEHGGQLCYDAVRDMQLLNCIVSEALRLYTPVGFLSRVVTQPLRLPGSDLTLEPGLQVRIPVWQLHHDPDHYPDPERFDPERFTPEAKERRHQYVYLPFGEGPRFCIAERFARLEMQMCLAAVLKEFRVLPTARSQRKPRLDTGSFAPRPEDGFGLRVELRA